MLQIGKKLETILSKRIELERLKVEEETVRRWQERLDLSITKSNDYRSLDTNIKKVLETMKNRLQVIQAAIRELE